jgi:hypothetical protein
MTAEPSMKVMKCQGELRWLWTHKILGPIVLQRRNIQAAHVQTLLYKTRAPT